MLENAGYQRHRRRCRRRFRRHGQEVVRYHHHQPHRWRRRDNYRRKAIVPFGPASKDYAGVAEVLPHFRQPTNDETARQHLMLLLLLLLLHVNRRP